MTEAETTIQPAEASDLETPVVVEEAAGSELKGGEDEKQVLPFEQKSFKGCAITVGEDSLKGTRRRRDREKVRRLFHERAQAGELGNNLNERSK